MAEALAADGAPPPSLPEPQHREARAGDLRSNLVSPTKAKDVLGWERRTKPAEGLRRTVAWFRSR